VGPTQPTRRYLLQSSVSDLFERLFTLALSWKKGSLPAITRCDQAASPYRLRCRLSPASRGIHMSSIVLRNQDLAVPEAFLWTKQEGSGHHRYRRFLSCPLHGGGCIRLPSGMVTRRWPQRKRRSLSRRPSSTFPATPVSAVSAHPLPMGRGKTP
jgi:hypothetical protein